MSETLNLLFKIGTGKCHVKTTKGVVQDTGKTIEDTGKYGADKL
ncbi:MAG: hypothetical protein WCK77_19105 [Verrucomicrobiota bacterium]